MAGARARKLDLTALIQGGHNVASILSNVDESGGVAGLLGGVAGGIAKYGANRREDKQRAEAKAEREKDRAFSQSLALKADARAEADQKMQAEKFGWEREDRTGTGGETDSLLSTASSLTKRGDAARQIAADTKIGETFATALARQVAASATGMPPDPLTLKQIQDSYAALQAKGGLQAVMARGSALKEDDPEGLIAETAQVGTLKSLLIARMGREKNSVKHAALGDALVQLSAIEDSNKYRLRLHEANSKRRMEVDEARAKAQAEADVKAKSEKADLDAFNADLKANGQKPVSSLEFGKMRERERVGDERARENNDLRERLKTKDQEIAVARDAAVKEDRASARMVRERLATETERHNRATEQLRALGSNNPRKDAMTALAQSAKQHLANAKEYGDYDSAVGDTTKAKEEMAAAQKAMDDLDALMRASGAAGTAPAGGAAPAAGETPWQKAQKDPDFATMTDAQREALRKRLGG